ncbi:MAG TPA: hypothetical protein DC038_06535 [Clostridiales bacterium]|nr:hypothetical protein [Clostridiales bacterium]
MDINVLVDILTELRANSMVANTEPTEQSIRQLIDKYDMLFLGEKFNTIYSMELGHAIKNHFKINIDNEELTKLLPEACKALNMEIEPMINVENIGKKSTPDSYKVLLW